MSKKFRVADFFCGTGGFSEGFRQMGFDVVFALDFWGPAIESHTLNHPKCQHSQMNILEIDTPEKIDEIIPDTEVIVGSPPCVSFSGSNKAGKADKTLGVQLIEAYLRIVAWKMNKPDSILKYWCLENVPNSEPFIKSEFTFKELGLPGKGTALTTSTRKVLNAADYGAPQTRTRFICGNYPEPEKTNSKDEWVTVGDVMDALHDPLGRVPNSVNDPVYGFEISCNQLTDHFYDSTVEEFEWSSAKRLKKDHGFMGKMSFPEDETKPSRTIMATRSASTREAMIFGGRVGAYGEYLTYRMPTIREIGCFMSFPITYQFQGNSESVKYKLVGNAVCPKKSSAIAKAILIKERMKVPKKFIPLENKKSKMDLTGAPYQKKEPRPRKPSAKFSMHIPYLKKSGMRVDLSNRFSDYKEMNFKWDCILHSGVGKGAQYYLIDQKKLEKLLSSRFIDGFEPFKASVIDTFNEKLPGPDVYQRIFCRLEPNNGTFGPEETINTVRELVDEHFPEEEFEDHWVEGAGKSLGVANRVEIPLRILAGVYALNHITLWINSS